MKNKQGEETMKTTKNIKKFKGYDLAVAKCHLENWGIVYLDQYGLPMDVEDVIEMLGEC